MDEDVRARAQRRPRILLLDLGMERVVHHPDARMPDRAHELREVGGGVRQVHLEAVQVLERDRDAAFLRVWRDLREVGDASLLLLVRRRRAGEDGERRAEWAADERCPERSG